MKQLIGRTLERITEADKGATYTEFNPPRRPEEWENQPGPHDGKALPYGMIAEIAKAKVTGKWHGQVVRGQWTRRDGEVFLDIAVDRAWVVANTHYQLIEGRLRWVCPVCQKLSGVHSKTCDYER